MTSTNLEVVCSNVCGCKAYPRETGSAHRLEIQDNGTIKLGDFGSACILNSSKAYAQTYVGTPYYVAPEIWDNKPYNNKSDVWSLGCVLYELCPLRHPFQATSWKSLILKVCRGAYPPLPEHLPYELRYLVKHMFKTNPKDRPSLQTILTSHRVSKLLRSHSPSQVMEAEEQGRRSCRWNREEGKKVAQLLGEKSLIITSTFEETSRKSLCVTGSRKLKECFQSTEASLLPRLTRSQHIITAYNGSHQVLIY
ncbi:serine/threonine-protein kinase Nek3 [Pleuronectes platessa]|uniref:serine/threonine-protein kinase Nek3 n=1 Tax=Pleuronectes platessa TaxID=8262 RepID=UPI00232A31A1|nr:serine/threonine-protein kinase Nek3 [Pleuronectes platessa]